MDTEWEGRGNYILGDFCPGDTQLFDAEAILGCRNALGFIYVLIDERVPYLSVMGNITEREKIMIAAIINYF